MKAMIIKQTGDANVFELADIDKPNVEAGHVIIKVLATSANQIDVKIRSGAVTNIAPELPAVLNADVAGIITEVGLGVEGFKVGDEVFGCAGGVKGVGGALAEYMLADANLIALKPKTFTMAQAAALPLVAITAYDALFLRAKIQANENILIHGGVGGVGHIAVQLAKHVGATVSTTVASDEQFALAKKLGATNTINFRNENVEDYVQRITNGEGFDTIFDTVGGPNLVNSFAASNHNATVVTTAARGEQDLSPLHNKALSFHVVFMLLPMLINKGRALHGEILQKLAGLVDDGALTVMIDSHEFNFEDIGKAHALLESGKAQGKVVLTSTWHD